MDTKIIIGIVVLIAVLGLGFSAINQKTDEKPSWIHEVSWSGKPGNAAKIGQLLWTEVIPYRSEYEKVNISARTEVDGLHIKVVASINESELDDIYNFIYNNEKLLLTGYLLEAVPPINRNEAIGIALQNQSVMSSAAYSGDPTVKRILPQTSQKYYAPKTLLSVSWKGISALVDPDERQVVQIWTESAAK